MVADAVLLVGVWRRWLACTLPWLLLNIMLILGLGAATMFLLGTVLVTPGTERETLKEVRILLIVIILNTLLTEAVIHLHSVIQTFIEMKRTSLIKTRSKDPETASTSCEDSSASLIRNEVGESQVEGRSRAEAGSLPDLHGSSSAYPRIHDSSFDSLTYDDTP